MFRHVLPNCMAPVAVLTTSMFGWVLLSESALSFLGLGVPPPAPTWGNMLAASRHYMENAIWLGIAPGLCIALTLLGINLLGDAVRDRSTPGWCRRMSAPSLSRRSAARWWSPPAAARSVVDDVSFDDRAGEFLAIVGESGSGKTMAARAMLACCRRGGRAGGRILLEGGPAAQPPNSCAPCAARRSAWCSRSR